MENRAGRAVPRPGEELAGLARRVIVLGIVAGAPVIAGTWLKDGPHDAWVRWGYPPLGLVLLSFAWILLRRPRWTVPAALSLLVVLELGWIVIALGRISEATSATDAWASLVPSPLLGVVVCLVVGFLFQGTRTALVHGSVYSFVFTAVVTAALWRRAGTADDAWLAVRYGVYLAVFLVLLFVLSRAKEHVTTAVAQAARADARATRMRDMAYLDELTGIANRRRLLDELVYQSELVTDTHPVCVVFFDLDHFKAVNDTHGHVLGDQVLRIVAEVAGRTVRDRDLLARLGGEEFVLVAPDTDHDQAVQLAERLRAALPLELEDRLGLRITASFGVTSMTPGESAASVLDRVDELMYRAKAGGRDRVQWAAGNP